jgi:hypothetical protein
MLGHGAAILDHLHVERVIALAHILACTGRDPARSLEGPPENLQSRAGVEVT